MCVGSIGDLRDIDYDNAAVGRSFSKEGVPSLGHKASGKWWHESCHSVVVQDT